MLFLGAYVSVIEIVAFKSQFAQVLHILFRGNRKLYYGILVELTADGKTIATM
jgi:hypothetical protein